MSHCKDSFLKGSGGLFLVLCHSRHRNLTPWWCYWLWPVSHSWLPKAERFVENPSPCQSDSLWAGGMQMPEMQPQGISPTGADFPLVWECPHTVQSGDVPLPRPRTNWEEWEWAFFEVTSVFTQPHPFDKQTLEGSWNLLVLHEGASVTMCKSQNQNKKLLLMWANFPGLFVLVITEEISTVA